jgi:hypothetical protein
LKSAIISGIPVGATLSDAKGHIYRQPAAARRIAGGRRAGQKLEHVDLPQLTETTPNGPWHALRFDSEFLVIGKTHVRGFGP